MGENNILAVGSCRYRGVELGRVARSVSVMRSLDVKRILIRSGSLRSCWAPDVESGPAKNKVRSVPARQDPSEAADLIGPLEASPTVGV